LRLQRGDWLWVNPEPIAITRTAQGKLDIPQFRLRSNESEIGIQAHLTPDGQVNGQIQIHQLRLQPNIQAVAPTAAVPDGQLSLYMALGGTLERPKVEGTLQLDALQWQENPLGNIEIQISLANHTLQSDLRWFDQQVELLRARGSVGLDAAGALAMQVTASNFDLGRLSSYSEAVVQSAGTLNLDLKLAGTPQQPDVKGNLVVSDGTLQLAATGEAYQDIQTDLRFTGNRLIFEQFQVGSRSGYVQLSGWLQTAGSTLDKLDIKMESQDFTALHTPDIQAVVTTDLTARGSLQELTVNGTVTIPRAQIRAEGLLGGAPAAVSPEQLTVDGVYGPGVASAETSNGKPSKKLKPAPLPFLRANVKVDMPKNVWVRARGTAIELRGKLDATKKLQQPFILFGDIETVRGFASFFGKKFGLEQGRITFTGTEEINPTLDVIATHKVSSYIVSIHVEGESQKPTLTLSSAPEELEEADIVSLLLFGKTSDRLTSSEESSLSNRAGKAAAGAAASAAAQVVGEQLGLDTIEVAFGDGSGEARIRAERYITQDIFLSYERQLGAESGNTVGVEYSLSRRLRLKGTSSDLGETALDLLWRWDY
jgi:translocation and assembly module TamB